MMSVENTKERIVTKCYYGCKFFTAMGDECWCNHPINSNKSIEERLLCVHENDIISIPENCPLKFQQVKVSDISIYKLQD